MVGSAGFELAAFAQEWCEAILYGFLQVTAPELRHPFRSANSLLACLPSGARRHTWLDYDPTYHRLLNKQILKQHDAEATSSNLS